MNIDKWYRSMLKCNYFFIDWTPKSGCTIVKKMWFNYMNILEEALEFHKGWIHDFTPTFHKRFGEATLDELKSDDFIKIKYVRNPYDRAVSSFIHGCENDLFGKYNDKNLSFFEFLDLLGSGNLGINEGKNHWRLQNSLPELEYNEIIKIENLSSETKRLNQKYNLDLNIYTSSHHIKKTSALKDFSNFRMLDVKFFIKTKKKFPSYDSFYTDKSKQLVYQIYKTDIERFNYKFPY